MISNVRHGVARMAKEANLALIGSMASEELITHVDAAAWFNTVDHAFYAANSRASSLLMQKQIRGTLQDIQRLARQKVALRALSKCKQMYDAGQSYGEIADALGISRSYAYQLVNGRSKNGHRPSPRPPKPGPPGTFHPIPPDPTCKQPL